MTAAAEADLADVWRFSADRWGIQQAERYVDAIRKALHPVVSRPECGRLPARALSAYRFVKAGRHLMFYRWNDDEVLVVRILHEGMDFTRHLR